MNAETKICPQCKRLLPLRCYGKRTQEWTLKDGTKRQRTGPDSYCKQCKNARQTIFFAKKRKARHDKLNHIDVALSTKDGFNNLLKEYGL